MGEGYTEEHSYRELWGAFRQAAEPHMVRFHQCHETPRKQQLRKLLELIRAGTTTRFGREHQFSDIHNYEDFKQHVPISNWHTTAAWVDKAVLSKQPVLSTEMPLFFEPTSGSSAHRKLIPYTPQLLLEFQAAIIVWLASLYDACPAIADGRAYWAISPQVLESESTANDIPIGCGNDMGYLVNSIVLPLLQSVLNPPGLKDTQNDWRTDSLVALINADDLSMISIWSPTFLLALLEPLMTNTALPDSSDNNQLNLIRDRIDSHRLVDFDRACQSGNFNLLWPRLVVLSTWAAGPSESFAKQLATHFPQTKIVPKGLLATEGVVSISYGTGEQCPIALDSHFLEFLAENGDVLLADEIQHGKRYQPLLTTGAGLYRYNLGDVVEIEHGADSKLLCVRFVGRADSRCDLVGEKLDEGLVQVACRAASDETMGVALVPNSDGNQANYVLVLDEQNAAKAKQTAHAVEQSLLQIHHYAQARKLDQIGTLELRCVASVSVLLQSAWESIGLIAGDYKPSVLVSSMPLAQVILAKCCTERKDDQ